MLEKSLSNKIMAGVARNTLRGVFREMNYEEYGGVPLLGVKGVSLSLDMVALRRKRLRT